MTWLSNSITYVECNFTDHKGERQHKVETAYHYSARTAMKTLGWHYDYVTGNHWCPVCVAFIARRN